MPRTVASDETSSTRSLLAVLGGEPLEQRVGVRREAHLERAALGVVADAVEDDDAARALHRDEARERVDELARRPRTARVEQVVAVEEVERRLSHRAARARLVEQHAPRRR